MLPLGIPVSGHSYFYSEHKAKLDSPFRTYVSAKTESGDEYGKLCTETRQRTYRNTPYMSSGKRRTR
ncbi:hypothetical protein BDW71DRAFT_181633 [Aspergillus fruticulosus]